MLTIGAVARRAGIRNSAVRYYEARGLLKPAARRPNGYRVYDENTVGLLNFVRRAQTLGITLTEVRKLLHLSPQGRRLCAEVKELARRHLIELDQKIRELEMLRKQLQSLLRRTGRQTPRRTICPLIEETTDKRQKS